MRREKFDLSTYITLPVPQDKMNKGDLFLLPGYKSPFRVVEILEKGLKAINTWTLKTQYVNITNNTSYRYDKLHNCAGSLYKPVNQKGKIVLELERGESEK